MTRLTLAFALISIAAVIHAWLRERMARLGERTDQVLGRDAYALLQSVESRQEQRAHLGMGDVPPSEAVGLLDGGRVPIGPRDFVVVERRGRSDYTTFEPWDGGSAA